MADREERKLSPTPGLVVASERTRAPGPRSLRGGASPACALALAATLMIALVASASLAQSPLERQHEDPQWALPGKDYAATRYSSLEELDTSNVASLEVAWTFSTGVLRGHEGQPLVIDGMMYFITPYPHIVYALDLQNPSVPAWTYEPVTDARGIGSACCDVVNRGVFFADGRLYFTTLDGQVFALNAETGELLWNARNADPHQGATITGHPLVAGDKVIVGMSGGEFGVRGYLTAYDAATGERVWRYYNTGPDEEVGIGERFDPFYDHHEGEDLGVTTWPGDQWRVGGATNWAWFTFDPDLNLVYYGTSNPGVWNASLRRANVHELEDQVRWANKWATSIMARDVDTGELVWAYQTTPHDEGDYDATQENILVDLEMDGETRQVLAHFDKNGFAYVIDRATGEVLRADPFTTVNWAERIDLETGLPVRNPEKVTGYGMLTENICPSDMGGKDQQPAAFSPETGHFYIPFSNLCMNLEGTSVTYSSGIPYVGATTRIFTGPEGHMGSFAAWDPVRGEKVWEIEERFSVWSGVLATGGDLAFYGTLDGWFRAVDVEDGEVVWEFQTGSGIVGAPITYLGPDGRQFVAVFSGVGGWPGLIVATDMRTDDPHAALGAANAFADLKDYTNKGGMLYVFALPGGGADAARTEGADATGGDAEMMEGGAADSAAADDAD